MLRLEDLLGDTQSPLVIVLRNAVMTFVYVNAAQLERDTNGRTLQLL